MKKIHFIVLLFFSFSGFAQYTLIPDLNFEKALIDLAIDSGTPDGRVLTVSVNGIKSLDVSGKNIKDLTGIQDFSALISFNCQNNQLTSLDITKNTSLTNLLCFNNQISSLNIANNTNLTYLDCNNNILNDLDVSKNVLLTSLYCNDNKLQNIDITKNISLKNFGCSSNQLISLDISKNTSLTYLTCFNNQLTSLDVSKNLFLTYFACSGNQLTQLDVTKNNSLTNLYCTSNRLTDLDLTNNKLLKELSCWNNQLTSLDVSKNTSLTLLFCDNNQISNLDVSQNTSLIIFSCSNNQLITLNLKNGNNSNVDISSFNLTSNPNLTCIQVDNKLFSDTNWFSKKDLIALYSESNCSLTANIAPVITATGDQAYCLLTSINIVTSIAITDPDDSSADAVYIQISSGYDFGEDNLFLNNPASHPTIEANWNASEGKLTLRSPSGIPVSYVDFIAAIKEVQFDNSSATASGSRTFSISIGQANYLPRNGHYYEYVPNIGITWTQAKAAAEGKTYYGLKGYLATLTAADEAQLAGEQAPGAGWIGGTDEKVEGEWRWVTGPEGLENGGNGIVFWNGVANGSSPNFAHWNFNEPNQFNGANEDYAHITAPGVGKAGSWNDLTNTGDPSGDYQPKGYIVEYGGMTGDPVLQLSAYTSITIPTIQNTIPATRCGSGTLTLQATASTGSIDWYDQNSGGNRVGSGTSFTTPVLNATTTYYATTTAGGCFTNRIAVTATINLIPDIVTTNSPLSSCGSAVVTLTATPTSGTVNWYADATSTNVLGTGTTFVTPLLQSNTTFYAEATNANCTNGNRVPVVVSIYPIPAVSDEEKIICQTNPVTLDAGLGGMSYLWSTGATSQTIQVNDVGAYFVAITSPDNCTSRKNILVVRQIVPEINEITVKETTVTIEMKNTAPYFEYSLDGIVYQSSNVFTDVAAGIQTAYVRNAYYCDWDQKKFIVISAPKFFTPNNDGYNDVWTVKDFEIFPEAKISIFDRFGKLLIELSPSKSAWDGTFNQKPLPASDYWYVLKLDASSVEKRGHFSLKR